MTKRLEQAINGMSPDAIRELEDFAEFLQSRRPNPEQAVPDRRLSLSWAGGLAHLRDQYASGVELAHAIRDEWADSVAPHATRTDGDKTHLDGD
ncbi:MAG TPA: DUF2281 domain-containing protein [Tepidisphaeraceae bacterium]|jgi:hypothetical protein|nr:DUF2281 domain-containing protein [Tepidisphaeraceae bacterium]